MIEIKIAKTSTLDGSHEFGARVIDFLAHLRARDDVTLHASLPLQIPESMQQRVIQSLRGDSIREGGFISFPIGVALSPQELKELTDWQQLQHREHRSLSIEQAMLWCSQHAKEFNSNSTTPYVYRVESALRYVLNKSVGYLHPADMSWIIEEHLELEEPLGDTGYFMAVDPMAIIDYVTACSSKDPTTRINRLIRYHEVLSTLGIDFSDAEIQQLIGMHVVLAIDLRSYYDVLPSAKRDSPFLITRTAALEGPCTAEVIAPLPPPESGSQIIAITALK